LYWTGQHDHISGSAFITMARLVSGVAPRMFLQFQHIIWR
jgi:hypothetical protein